MLAEIKQATQALAQGIGALPGTTRKQTLRREQAIAHTDCAAACNLVFADIEWFLSNASDGPARATAQALYQPLVDLLDRHPSAGTTKTTSPSAPSAPAAPATPTAAPTTPEGHAPAAKKSSATKPVATKKH